jgi:hypothetical protein
MDNIKSKIQDIMLRYFQTDSNGDISSTFDDTYSATDAIDDIVEIIGGFYNPKNKEN